MNITYTTDKERPRLDLSGQTGAEHARFANLAANPNGINRVVLYDPETRVLSITWDRVPGDVEGLDESVGNPVNLPDPDLETLAAMRGVDAEQPRPDILMDLEGLNDG